MIRISFLGSWTRYCLLICIVLAHLSCKAQTPADTVIKRIQRHYNAADYNAMHTFLSPNGQQQMPVADMAAFFNENVQPYFGQWLQTKAINVSPDQWEYKLTFEKGQIHLSVLVNEQQKIEAWLWEPVEPEQGEAASPSHTSSWPFQNLLSTAQDSMVHNIAIAYTQKSMGSAFSIAVVDAHNIQYYHYGTLAKNNTETVTQQSIYEMGSITKVFVAQLIAKAITEGKLHLDDAVADLLKQKFPALTYKNETIKIRHLLNHSAGLPKLPSNALNHIGYNQQDPYAHYDTTLLFDFLRHYNLSTKPGTQMEYSNLGYGLLGYILEQTYQQPLLTQINEYITTHMAMEKVYFDTTTTTPVTTGYNEVGKETPWWHFKVMAGAGAIKTSAQNLAVFLQHHITATNPVVKLTHETVQPVAQQPIAYAWFENKPKPNTTLYWHNGGTYGYSSFIAFCKEKKKGIVVLSNSGISVDEVAGAVLKKLLDF
jgi:CubicO group peptidase (beta-lactamase class C family)